MSLKGAASALGRRDWERGYLTKTLYVDGLACRKKLWLEFNSPESLPEERESAQFQMDQGRRVGELARKRFPDATLVGEREAEENDRRSRKLLEERVPLLEAGFFLPGKTSYARADALLPVGKDEWDIVEVKSASEVRPEYVEDVAFQRYCYSGAGLRIRRCFLLHVDTSYVRRGEVDPLKLFHQADVTTQVAALLPCVQTNIESLLETTRLKECPEFGKGELFHDDDGLHDDDAIWKSHPDSDIRDLRGLQKLKRGLLASGVFRIRDIPKGTKLNGQQAIQQAAHTTGQPHVDPKKITAFLELLEYPLHFIDFETTYGTAIPLFDGTSPYQAIPFQYSLHVVKELGGEPLAYSFLSLEPEDPRRSLVASLQREIGPRGSVVAYNAGFEKRILIDLGLTFPETAEWVRGITARMVDLWKPFRRLDYYNAKQQGSASIKAVLPALTGRSYDGLDITEGGMASLAYLHAAFPSLFREELTPSETAETRTRLMRYCGQDTEGMVWIVNALAEVAKAVGN